MTNVVLVTLDECKASALGCYGEEEARTPALDAFARDGVQLDRAFCTFPKCTPSRASLVTGRYPHVEGHRTLPGFEVQRGENNLVSELRAAGYRTGMVGKNHTIAPIFLDDCFDVRPEPRGAGVPVARRDDETDDALFRAFYRGDFSDVEQNSDTFATHEALRFLEETDGRPFFLLVNYNAPHPPYVDIEPFASRIDAKQIVLPERESLDETPAVLRVHREIYDLEEFSDDDWRRVVRAYFSMVSFVDAQVGTLLASLDSQGLTEDTIVVITSDHGDFAGEHGCVEKWDTLFYDCLVRVPLLVRWAGRLPAGRSSDALVENVDVAPTLMDLCGLGVPDWMHGRSLRDVLSGVTDEHKDAVFAEGGVEDAALVRTIALDTEEHRSRHPNYHWKQALLVEQPWTLRRAKMVRTDRWKLVYRVDGTKELYDLDSDPGELHDVAALPQHQTVVAELVERLLNWAVRTETDYPRIETMFS